MTDPHLARACAIVAAKDRTELRRAMFAQLAARRPAVRAARATYARLGRGRRAAGFVGLLALARYASLRLPARDGDLVTIARYRNEARRYARLAKLAPALRMASIEVAPGGAPSALSPRAVAARLADGWAPLVEHARAGDFLVAARVAETVGFYLRLRPWLAARPERAVLVSSDTNPYAVALTQAARSLGRATAFVAHGQVGEGPPPLDFDLSLLEGLATREVYERAGPVAGEVAYTGAEGDARPMAPARLERGVRRLGLVMSILVDWAAAGATLERLRAALAPAEVVLRLHPNRDMRDPRWRDRVRLDGVRISEGDRPLAEDVDGCDLVVAANTSAHLAVLKRGVPTVFVPALDRMGPDLYGLVRERVVAPLSPGGAIEPPEIARFYEDPAWAARLARFDASYPDRQARCDDAVRAALARLVGERAAAPPRARGARS